MNRRQKKKLIGRLGFKTYRTYKDYLKLCKKFSEYLSLGKVKINGVGTSPDSIKSEPVIVQFSCGSWIPKGKTFECVPNILELKKASKSYSIRVLGGDQNEQKADEEIRKEVMS
jgi:hypothetical protein